ncbi:MAG: FtsX-like permease family protein [Cytophagales bacterium]|nr:FtsX-like permease family protein [Cytophagales bacterium]
MSKSVSFKLQPITDIHLRSEGIRDRLVHSDIRLVWLFGAIAGFIMIIACINFINLFTARSANRAREVGLRKVVGPSHGNLVRQFLTDSVLFSLISFILGAIIAWLFLPYFNRLAAKSLVFPWAEW